ncbi:MAG: hypothetical protein J5824_08340 [Lachnospiraceae bacterium]|nr:hypothetical protein [Lachnospiraceae bacterium]
MAKKYLKLLGMECLYLITLVVVACLAGLVQFIGRKYIGDHSSFIFSGSDYSYNVFAYLAGILLFAGYIFLTYKKLVNKHEVKIAEFTWQLKLILILVMLLFCFAMFICIAMEFFVILGFGDNMKPEILLVVTAVGLPAATAVYMSVIVIRNWKAGE